MYFIFVDSSEDINVLIRDLGIGLAAGVILILVRVFGHNPSANWKWECNACKYTFETRSLEYNNDNPYITQDDPTLTETENDKPRYTLILENPGSKKINVIKVVRELTRLSLSVSKNLIDTAPSIISTDIPGNKINIFKQKFEEAGATVTIKETVSE